ncbi:MAG TPA: GNAT family N-acetyltransferase [Candidatus Nanopelagicales bacterium]|nr:GNAT family N-acetyltransferase [Candidatus Nanopelagicales bacterium]
MAGGIAREIEAHESRAWAACVEAAAAADGNPLDATVDVVAGQRVPALGAIDAALFNRVIGLGVSTPCEGSVLDKVIASYGVRGQSRFTIEVTPSSEPADLRERLAERGLVDSGYRQAKCWQVPEPYEGEHRDLVERLTEDDADEFAQVNMLAWEVPAFLAVWFGATLFAEGFRHFGVREGGRLVSVGGMYVSDGIAWLGFGATLPDHRGRGMQKAVLARRIHEAASLDCHLVHTETEAHTAEVRNPSLANMVAVGFEHAYDKEWWATAPSA